MRNRILTWGFAILASVLAVAFLAGVAIQRIWMDGAEWQMRRAAAPYEFRLAKKATSQPKAPGHDCTGDAAREE